MVTGLLSTCKVEKPYNEMQSIQLQYQEVLGTLKASHITNKAVVPYKCVILTIPTRAPSLPEALPLGESSSSNSSPPDSYYDDGTHQYGTTYTSYICSWLEP